MAILLRILRFPGYFETPPFRTFFHFPWDFETAGFKPGVLNKVLYGEAPIGKRESRDKERQSREEPVRVASPSYAGYAFMKYNGVLELRNLFFALLET